MINYDLALLSKYRTQLMGFAILWITLYHTTFVFYIPIISEIKWLGYAGVEIFFFVSGIGLFFSWHQTPSIIFFYKKRFLRIFPIHIFITIIFTSIAIYLYKYDISLLFYSITTLGFWIKKGDILTSPWFISAIVFLYFITPLFLKYFQSKILIASISVSLISIVITILISGTDFNYLQIFTARVPSFFLGLYIGCLIIRNRKISFYYVIILYAMLIIGISSIVWILHNTGKGYGFIRFGFIWFPLIFTTFPTCMLLSIIYQKFTPHIVTTILTFCGTYSLVIYLYHEKILFLFAYHTKMTGSQQNILAIIIAFIVGYFTQKGIGYIIDRYNKKNIIGT